MRCDGWNPGGSFTSVEISLIAGALRCERVEGRTPSTTAPITTISAVEPAQTLVPDHDEGEAGDQDAVARPPDRPRDRGDLVFDQPKRCMPMASNTTGSEKPAMRRLRTASRDTRTSV
jgi:hypothetical protein